MSIFLGIRMYICLFQRSRSFSRRNIRKGLAIIGKATSLLGGGEAAVGEARHRNLYLPYVPERIYDTAPDAKIIILLRNPIERAYSHWWHWFSRGLEQLPFEEAISQDLDRIEHGISFQGEEGVELWTRNFDFAHGKNEFRTYIDSGYYSTQIRRYLTLFPTERVKVITLEDLSSTPAEMAVDLWSFLGVDPDMRTGIFDQRNQSLSGVAVKASRYAARVRVNKLLPRSSKNVAMRLLNRLGRKGMLPSTRKNLKQHYLSHNQDLENLLHRDLSLWNK